MPLFWQKIKINIDVAYAETQRGGIGLIARDHLRSFIAAKVCPCKTNSALELEAIGVEEACSFTIKHKFRQVQFMMDCREVIREVQGHISRGQWGLYPFLCKIKEQRWA